MSRISRILASCSLAASVAAGLTLFMACGGGSSSSSNTPSSPVSSGSVNMFVTDAPSDDWQEVTVTLKDISVRNHTDQTLTSIWSPDAANPDSGKINLVDLSSVAELLGKAKIPVGTYDRIILTINTDPSTMNLMADDGTVYTGSAAVKVMDPSGKGQIAVTLDPAITVAEGTTTNLQVDFDLAHPLALTVQNGIVVVNLQVRFKPIVNAHDIQFARHRGTVTAVTSNSLSVHTLRGADITYTVDGNTWYWDADAKALGNAAGVTVGKGVLVASNMNSDGSLYARRVWYAADVTTLPQYTPEGLVRRVNNGMGNVYSFKINHKDGSTGHWEGVTINVDDNTTWTFHDTVPMGMGKTLLSDIWRGTRVDVELVDPLATPKVAKTVNVHSIHDEGDITAISGTNFTFGWGMHTRTYPYSAVTDHPFDWWYFALPSSASTSVSDLQDTITQALNANLRVFGWTNLYWDAAQSAWASEHMILSPEKLLDPTAITTAYSAATGTMDVSYPDPDTNATQSMTIALDSTGDLQTVVESFGWNHTSRILTVTIPVDPAQWPTLLTPSLTGVRVWVRPVKATDGTFSWHAYTIRALQVQ